jgi:hypothetical protein
MRKLDKIFTSRSIIRRYVVWDTDNLVKSTLNHQPSKDSRNWWGSPCKLILVK